MAERLARIFAAQLGIPDITTSSAGIHAMIGSGIHAEAARVIKEYGGDAEVFAARQINAKIASGADLILTMTRTHRDVVLELAPRMLRRTYTLKGAAELTTGWNVQRVDELAVLRNHIPANESLDIADPIGQSPEFFTAVGAHISDLMPPVLRFCQSAANT